MKIRWTEIAVSHLQSVQEYVTAQGGATAANRLVDRIFSSVSSLERHPGLGHRGRVEGTRELVVAGTPYIIVYRLLDTQVQILGVLHAARRWPDRFE